ncbi:MAG: zinc transporter ZntB [Alphaproteobacteria bacterium]|nr:zinc transporter ZntB [Alphaproteobacteria bacterium]
MPVVPIERNDHSEPNAEAFIFGFEFPPEGAVHRIDWSAAKATAACPPSGWRWLHLNRLSDETRDWLETSSDLDETVISALLQAETRPRCLAHDDGVLLNLRGINHNPGAEPEDMISVRMWATKNLVISMRSYPVKAIHDVRELTASGAGPGSPGDLLVMIAASLVDRIEPVVEQLNDEADEFEEKLLKEDEDVPPSELAEFRRSILLLRRYIQPQRDAMVQLQREGRLLIQADQVTDLREIADRVTRIAEELDTIRDRAAVIQDQISGQRQEELNQRLLALSVISALFLPLTFLTGLLGMNLAGIPFSHSPWAFGFVVALSVALAAALLIYLRVKRWI